MFIYMFIKKLSMTIDKLDAQCMCVCVFKSDDLLLDNLPIDNEIRQVDLE